MNMLLLSQSCVAPASARATRAAVATALAAVAAAAATASTASSAATTKASSSSSLSSPAAPVAAIAAAAASSLTNAATQALSGCAAAVAAVAKLWTRCKMALLRLLGLACAPSDDTTADDGADATLTHAHVDGASRDDDGQGQTSQDAKDQGEDARQPTQLAEAVRDDQDDQADQDDQDKEDDDEASLRDETTTASMPTTTKIAEPTETAETAETTTEPAETAVATTTTACAPTLESDSNSNDPSDASDSNETEPEPEASVLAAEQPETQGAAPDALLDAYRAAVTTRHAALGSFPFDTVLQIVIRLHEEFHGHAIRLDGALQDGPGYSKDENALALVDVVVDALRYMEYDPERTLTSLLDDWLPQHHAYTWFCAKDFTDAKAAERRSGLFTLYAL